MAQYVYELTSERRKEIFVGIASSLDAELRRMRKTPPAELAAWPEDDRRKLRIVEILQDSSEARSFLRRHTRSSLPRGWRFLIEGSSDPAKADR